MAEHLMSSWKSIIINIIKKEQIALPQNPCVPLKFLRKKVAGIDEVPSNPKFPLCRDCDSHAHLYETDLCPNAPIGDNIWQFDEFSPKTRGEGMSCLLS
jgi:hypothetical protein